MKSEPLVLKGTKQGLMIIVRDVIEVSKFKEKLKEKFHRSRGFFTGGDVIIDLGNMEISEEDKQKIRDILKKDYDMNLKEIKNYRSHPKDFIIKPPKSACDTFIIKKTLRSGQKINCNGSLIILGDVNPGAEVIATSDILVFGVLRGTAHAGAAGDSGALVAAFRLQPTQLRIADKFSRAPDGETVIPDYPEVAVIREGNIYIEPYLNLVEKNFKEGI